MAGVYTSHGIFRIYLSALHKLIYYARIKLFVFTRIKRHGALSALVFFLEISVTTPVLFSNCYDYMYSRTAILYHLRPRRLLDTGTQRKNHYF